MSNISLITLEQLQNALDHVDWNLCFTGQQNERQDLQNPKDKRGKKNSSKANYLCYKVFSTFVYLKLCT